MYKCICKYMYIYIYVYICMYTCMYVYVCRDTDQTATPGTDSRSRNYMT